MLELILTSFALGVGLAMDAFSVSLANGLNENKMKTYKMCIVAGTFAFFQALMPLIGWFCVHNLAKQFEVVSRFVPLCALILLTIIGTKMLIEGIKDLKDPECECKTGKILTPVSLIVQGIATSIDALSVGFTIASYDTLEAFFCALIIALVTFIICMIGIFIGKKFGTRLSCKATIFGGCILIFIGLEIFITSLF
jgi:putative Mn2+ efflux pump MntP